MMHAFLHFIDETTHLLGKNALNGGRVLVLLLWS